MRKDMVSLYLAYVTDAIEEVEMTKKADKVRPPAECKLSSKGSESATKTSIGTSDKSGKKYALQFRSSVTVMTSNVSEDSSIASQNSLPESSEFSPYAQRYDDKRLSESSEVTSIYTVRKYTTSNPDEFCPVDDFERNYKPQPLTKDKILFNSVSFKEDPSSSDCKDTTMLVEEPSTIDEEDVFLAFPDTS